MTMATFKCPKCEEKVEVISAYAEVGHNCPNNKSKFTLFERVDKDK